MRIIHILLSLLLVAKFAFAQDSKNDKTPFEPVDYVNTLMGTDSEPALSNGNTYPAIAVPWGMNFWTPQTGSMGNGWAIPTMQIKFVDLNKLINHHHG